MQGRRNRGKNDDSSRGSAAFGKGQLSWARKDEIMRHIEVKYQNGTHAFVDDYLLDALIHSRQIQQFYRPSEKRWVTVRTDAVRSGTKNSYSGCERRRTGHYREMIPVDRQNDARIPY
jgi:hypothetical protein